MFSRRKLLFSSAGSALAGLFLGRSAAAQTHVHSHAPAPAPTPAPAPAHVHAPAPAPAPAQPARRPAGPRTRVITPNGASLPFKMENGVKVFHLTAEPVKREFVDGLNVNCWGYNGMTPGPTIEAFEGDRVRIYVTNKLPE